MKNLRSIRIVLAVIFLAASVAYLFAGRVSSVARVSAAAQIVPSAIAVTLGATLFWLAVTFVAGRVYCSTVCPLGTIQDAAFRLRRLIPGLRRPLGYTHARPTRYRVLLAYVLSLILGISAVAYLLEPWNIMSSAAGAVRRAAVAGTWGTLGYGAAAGIAAGVATVAGVFVWALLRGRAFCNTVCPVGTMLGMAVPYAWYHIEIDPDRCTSCMKCEEVCRSRCVKVVSRYVDNTRCVRCLDCLDVCGDDAIRMQHNRNRPASPLMRRVKQRT